MGIIIVDHKLTANDIKIAREDHDTHIKITIDIFKETVLIGGELHYDAEQILINKHGSRQQNIWGGGYDLVAKKIRTEAMINLRGNNDSTEILDSVARKKFVSLTETIVRKIVKLI